MADSLFATRYLHASAHDARWDGEFVTCWLMSENFCRPGCSQRTPRPSRVVFYRTAAAAHAAGFRPCPRCRPDMTPPSPELTSGDSVAARALRLVADGGINRYGVGGVAKRVGVSPRQVLRAVEAATDCGTLGIARVGRARLARLLLTGTSIPMRDVAVAAGFATVRQFNATIVEFYRTTPGTIRFGRRHAVTAEREPGPLVVRCPLPIPHVVGTDVFAALAQRLIPDVEEGTDRWFARTVRLPYGAGHLRVDLDGSGRLFAKLTCADLRDFAPLVYRTQQIFVPSPAAPSGATDLSESLIRAQVERRSSPTSSRTVLGGMVKALGDVTPWGLLFPAARVVADAGRTVLRGPAPRVDAVIGAAQAIADGDIDVDGAWTLQALGARHPRLLAV